MGSRYVTLDSIPNQYPFRLRDLGLTNSVGVFDDARLNVMFDFALACSETLLVLKFSKKNALSESAEVEGTVFANDIQPQYHANDDVDGRQSHGGARGNRGRYGLGRIFSRRVANNLHNRTVIRENVGASLEPSSCVDDSSSPESFERDVNVLDPGDERSSHTLDCLPVSPIATVCLGRKQPAIMRRALVSLNHFAKFAIVN